MNNPTAELTEEDDIELGNVETVSSSPHQINKKAVGAKLILDNAPGKGWYSSRIGINLYNLAKSKFTMAFELIWTIGRVDVDTVSLNAVSSIETIHNVSKKVFNNHARLIIQFEKNQQIGNNYLYIDIQIKFKTGETYLPKLQTYIICYGQRGLVSDVPTGLYDAVWTIGNDKIIMNEMIDMNRKKIIGIKDTTVDSGAVNYKQLSENKTELKNLINAKFDKSGGDISGELDMNDNKIIGLAAPTAGKHAVNKEYLDNKIQKSYYENLFGDYYFDLLDPNTFDVKQSASGPIIEKINKKLALISDPRKPNLVFDLARFNVKYGFDTIDFTNAYNSMSFFAGIKQNTNFTILMTMKLSNDSNTELKFNNLGLINRLYLRIDNDEFKVWQFIGSDKKEYKKSMLSAYKNRQIMVWFARRATDNRIHVNLCDNGGFINESTGFKFNANKIQIHTSAYITRLGYTLNFYPVNGPEFHKILFMEKKRGTFFQ